MARTKRARSLHVLPEPKWSDYKSLTDVEQQHKVFQDCLYWVHYEIPEKRQIPAFKKWMKEHWDKDTVAKISKLPDSSFTLFSKYAYCWSKLTWMPDDAANYYNSIKDELLKDAEEYVEEKETTPKTKVVNIRENLLEFTNAVDDAIEGIIYGKKVTNYQSFVEAYNLNKAEIEQAVSIVDDFAMEFRELAQGEDEQLLEGYSHVKKATLTHLLTFFDGIVTALLETKQAKKVVRIRRKRPVDKNKLVRRLKYTQSYPDLNLKSIDPVEIIGASEVWVYDIKRKRLGVYASEFAGTLSVKGTVIENYALSKSYEKTVRKEEKISEFMQCRKNGLHKFMDSIRGKRFPAKSRVQATMVLLRVVA